MSSHATDLAVYAKSSLLLLCGPSVSKTSQSVVGTASIVAAAATVDLSSGVRVLTVVIVNSEAGLTNAVALRSQRERQRLIQARGHVWTLATDRHRDAKRYVSK